MPVNPANIRNILVVRNDRFGEFLLNIPAFRALKETYPKARLIAIVDPDNKMLAGAIECIDEVIEWKTGEHTFPEKIKLINLLIARRIDVAVILNPLREFNFVTWACGIPLRVGYDRKWGFFLNRRMKDRKYLEEMHEVDYNLALVGLAGAKTIDKSLHIGVPVNSIKLEVAQPLVAIHPWTSDPVKQWPVERFLDLADKIVSELGASVVIVGGPDEELKSRELFARPSGKVVNLTGKTNLLQLAEVLKGCSVLISGDSGPVHLSACVNTPVVALFRSDMPGKGPRRWGPWGRNHTVICRDKLTDISTEEVFARVKEKLGL